MNLENRIKQYLDNSIEFVEWQKDGLTLNDVTWLMEDFINHDRLVRKNNKPFAIPAVSGRSEQLFCSCGKPSKIPICMDCFKKGLERNEVK